MLYWRDWRTITVDHSQSGPNSFVRFIDVLCVIYEFGVLLVNAIDRRRGARSSEGISKTERDVWVKYEWIKMHLLSFVYIPNGMKMKWNNGALCELV